MLPATARPLQGKSVIVTGGTSGLGKCVAQELSARGARCTILGSDVAKWERAQQEIREAAPGPPADMQFVQVDLTSLRAVTQFGSSWRQEHKRLDLLVMIAGTFITEYRRTEDGFEQTAASNYLGHFYLAHLLLQELQAAAPSRIVWMASAYEQLGRVQWDDIGGEFSRDSGLGMYCSANLYCIMAAQEMQRRLRASGSEVDVFSVQPGLVSTPLYNKADLAKPSTWFNWPAARLFGQSPARGATSAVHCATSLELQGKGWGYYGPPYLGPLALPLFNHWRWRPFNRWAHNKEAQKSLYEKTVDLLVEKTGEPLQSRMPASS